MMAGMTPVLLALILWVPNFFFARWLGGRAGMRYEASWLAGILGVLGTLVLAIILAIDGPQQTAR